MPRISVILLLIGAQATAQAPGDAEAPGLSLSGREASVVRRVIGFTREARRLVVSAETTGRLLEVLVAEGATVPRAAEEKESPEPQQHEWAVVARVDCERLRLQREAEEAALALAQEDTEYFERERLRVMNLDRGLTTDETRLAKTHGAEVARLVAEAAAVSLALATDQVSRCDVRAPAGLVVLRTLAEPGELMQPGTPILELADLGVLEVDLRLSEEEIRSLRAQESTAVNVLDHPELTNGHATVAVRDFEVYPEFDSVSRKRRVELRLDGADLPEASGGLRVQLSLRVRDSSGAWRVPVRYLLERPGDVVVMTSEGAARVTILRREGEDAIVLGSGLSEQTLLVMPGSEKSRQEDGSDGGR